MVYGDWLKPNGRVFISESRNPHYGDTGYITGTGSAGGVLVHLSKDPEGWTRTFAAWDLEDITPYNEDIPEEL